MFKKIIERLQDYFGISRKEARGALVLMVLCFFLVWAPYIFRRWVLPFFPPMSEPIDIKKLDSIAVELEKENQLKFKKRKSYPENAFKNKIKPPGKPFDFDPNTISVDGLMQLGVPAFLAKRIDKFRNKGGTFRRKEDLLTIYDFPAELYNRLENHIILPPSPSSNDKKTDRENSSPRTAEIRESYRKPILETFDINTADTVQLVKLKGIGTKLSLRILKFRDALGGFHSTTQYSEIFGLDSLALSELNQYAKVVSPVTKIHINTITAADLAKHSYLRNQKIVSVIINYRDQHGPFQNIGDLRKTKVLDESVLKKIEPYLSF